MSETKQKVTEINNIIMNILKRFFDKFQLDAAKINCSIEITDDIQGVYAILKNTDKKELSFLKGADGIMVCPENLNSSYLILIDLKIGTDFLERKSVQLLSTVTREITHVFNYNDYANIKNLKTHTALLNDEYYKEFYLWSEYDACCKSNMFLLEPAVSDENTKAETLKGIKDREFKYYEYRLIRDFHMLRNNPQKFNPILFKYLGRFSAWATTFSDEELFKKLPSELTELIGDDTEKLYEALRNSHNAIKFTKNKEQIKNIINKINNL